MSEEKYREFKIKFKKLLLEAVEVYGLSPAELGPLMSEGLAFCLACLGASDEETKGLLDLVFESYKVHRNELEKDDR